MKRSLLLIFILCVSHLAKSQDTLLFEPFTSTLPGNWTMNPANTWEYHSTGGLDQSGSAHVFRGDDSWFQGPAVDLSTIQNPVASWWVAGHNPVFKTPRLTFWYNTGAGWQFIDDWGRSGSTANNSLNWDLDDEDPNWVPNTDSGDYEQVFVDLSAFASETNIRFAWGLQHSFVGGNRSHIYLDDIFIGDTTNTQPPVGIDQALDQDRFQLYPQPANERLSIIASEGITSWKIYSLTGQLLAGQTTNGQQRLEIPLTAQMNSGLYVMEIETRSKRKTRRKFTVK